MVVVWDGCRYRGSCGGLLQTHPGWPSRDSLTGRRQATHGRIVQGGPATGVHCARPEASLRSKGCQSTANKVRHRQGKKKIGIKIFQSLLDCWELHLECVRIFFGRVVLACACLIFLQYRQLVLPGRPQASAWQSLLASQAKHHSASSLREGSIRPMSWSIAFRDVDIPKKVGKTCSGWGIAHAMPHRPIR